MRGYDEIRIIPVHQFTFYKMVTYWLCLSQNDRGIVQVSQESQDTQTGGGGVSCVHPGMIPGSSEYPRNPRILRQGGGELCPSRDVPRIVRVSQESQDTQTGGVVSCVHPGMIPGSSEYPRNPRILRQGGSELCPSRDDPGIVRVSQESQDTQTAGGGMIPGSSEYPRNPAILRQGG